MNLVERAAEDFGVFAYDGFGVMLSDEQLEARALLGKPGPRHEGEFKVNWLSGGQRSGKTVLAALCHAEAGLYKSGLDNSDGLYWRNYQYGTLAIAPTEELTLRLWAIMDELSKGANDAQFDRYARRSRGGKFLNKMQAGKTGRWPIVRFTNNSRVDFRSSEGWAIRLEGGQWWFVTWDEWASQPDREIPKVLRDVLYGRARDHDAKIMPMAWPKPETERHLIEVVRSIETGRDRDSQVIYLSAEAAYFTNRKALAVERRQKDESQWKRTVLGQPAGGSNVEFPTFVIDRAINDDLPKTPALAEEGYDYFASWDLGMAHDSTVGLVWRIPIVDGKRRVMPDAKARIVNWIEVPGGEQTTLDEIAFKIASTQQLYRAQTAVDASAMGGIAAFRELRDLNPSPYAFVSRSNHRIYGNMRLAAITNGLDMLTWGRPEEGAPEGTWGNVEMPRIQKLIDQLGYFDRDDKDVPDDWVWSFLIGLWYIRRWWTVGDPHAYQPREFDVRVPRAIRNPARKRGRSRLVGGVDTTPDGVVYIRPPR